MHKLANAVQKKVYRLYRKYLKEPTLQIQARATTGVGKPQADSEGNERIPPDGFDMAALEVHFMEKSLHHPSFHNNKSRTRKGTAFLGNPAQSLCGITFRKH